MITVAPFMIAEYGWSQATAASTFAIFYVGTTMTIIFAAKLITALEPHGELKAFCYASWIVFGGAISWCFAPLSPIFAFIGLVFVSIGAGLWIPAYKIALAKMEP